MSLFIQNLPMRQLAMVSCVISVFYMDLTTEGLGAKYVAQLREADYHL